MSTELKDARSGFWSVARTEPKHEAFAAKWVEAAGFEVFLPRLIGRGGITPMFSNYLFVNINGHLWQRVDRTPGVAGLIKFGDQPARCPDAEIAALKARCGPDGLARLPPPLPKRRAFAKGEPVRVLGGAFEGVAAIHSGMTAKEREIVLIAMLGSTRQVAVPAHLVAARG